MCEKECSLGCGSGCEWDFALVYLWACGSGYVSESGWAYVLACASV